MNWEDIGEIKSSKSKMKVMELLKTGFFLPTEISRTLNIHLSTISRTLSILESKGFIKCVNPQRRKGKLFTLTKDGQEILRDIKALKTK